MNCDIYKIIVLTSPDYQSNYNNALLVLTT